MNWPIKQKEGRRLGDEEEDPSIDFISCFVHLMFMFVFYVVVVVSKVYCVRFFLTLRVGNT